jgi:SAM-dependent methyltransferase
MDDDYLDLNRSSWDERAPAHAASPDYNLQGYVDDPAYIGHLVQFDRPLLGDLSGLRGVHLQGHIGTDTIGLSRLGARMTGLDFSPAAIEQARALVKKSGDDVSFVQSDVYDAVSALGGEKFDIIFTGIGALCWLPNIARWAAIVSALLKSGGRLFIREGHPMLWSLADARPDGFSSLTFRISRGTNPRYGTTAAPMSRPMWSSRPTRPIRGTKDSPRSCRSWWLRACRLRALWSTTVSPGRSFRGR